ncbi:hypothetical protein LUZ61_002398 [Rhynchospora tenuis]|uniref:Kinesin motor domain-containing protein n=1 Tax=Rhynchospora tenuis TaxID=198213 RepID=A0AAD5ZJ05_9POAL|nr:hypothetical protein LUZ61_002398 [Rhynchospora tenuis]
MNSSGEVNASGIIPRIMEKIFEKIYNEEIFDLLDQQTDTVKPKNCQVMRSKHGMRVTIQIRETTGEIALVGVNEVSVKSQEDMASFLARGSKKRVTARTLMNNRSSRSHAIFTIYGEQAGDFGDDILVSKLQLVDLAGSERAKPTCSDGLRLKEGIQINKALLALGNAISALGGEKKHKEGAFVAYRESKLTRQLMKDFNPRSNKFIPMIYLTNCSGKA